VATGLVDEFTCSLCMDILTDPVSIPCGHSFCLECLTDCWDQSQVCRCPQCRENFTARPELHINTVLNEVVKKLQRVGLRSPPFQNYAGPGDVECDFCIGKKFRAVKPCLTCPASYCQTHLQPHFEIAEKFCAKHQKCLEIFCTTNETCICSRSLETDREEKAVSNWAPDDPKSLDSLTQCLTCISEWMNSNFLKLNKEKTEILVIGNNGYNENSRIFFFIPTDSVQSDELYTVDGVHLRLVSEAPDWFLLIVSVVQRHPVIFFCLFSQFCPLTLDINTTHKDLHLSEGNKKVTCERTKPEYPDHPDRFDYWEQILCREALTGTRSYWEVECTGDWVLIGVAYKGLSRKGKDLAFSFGSNDKSWSLPCADSQYAVRHNDEDTKISTPYSPRIGVYLDWPAGSLAFYSVSHTMTLLHRFNTSFTEPLYPGLGFWLDCKSMSEDEDSPVSQMSAIMTESLDVTLHNKLHLLLLDPRTFTICTLETPTSSENELLKSRLEREH
uniref:B30.2/SPRY domain-containing protein n=1 Tax=Erpetoichthys calabaricus TaxID=27687 RepID=A0A8C4XDD6_ERPCA